MQLFNNRLRVDIAEPAALYHGTRFDWTGIVTQVSLDNRHTFCSVESRVAGQGTGGVGLCNEFGLFRPVNFDETQAGEAFLKIGVGLLTRPDEAPYDFQRTYDFTTFQVSTSYAKDAVRYVVHPDECRGYAVRLEKTVRLEDNRLHIEYALHNVGSRRIQTHEYNHNFLAINNAPIGPDYRLQSPVVFKGTKIPRSLDVQGCEVRWHKTPKSAFYYRDSHPQIEAQQPLWELIHEPSGAGVRESGDYALSMFALWGTAHVVSPETFVDIDVQPGQTQRWARRYEFFSV